MIIDWLNKLIVTYAREISAGGQSIYKFDEKIEELLSKSPIQDWEADRWWRGIKTRLIKDHGHFFRVGSGKNSALSLFVRNEAGLNVGLRRESITQMATYVTLITDYGFSRQRVQFESRWMDVVVNDEEGSALIYAENKAAEKTLRKLCDRLQNDFSESIPYVSDEEWEENKKIDDAIMKANHIWRNRPVYFWGVSPTFRQAYSINYLENGFRLISVSDIPNYLFANSTTTAPKVVSF